MTRGFRGSTGSRSGRSGGSRHSGSSKEYTFDEETLKAVQRSCYSSSSPDAQLPSLKQVDESLTARLKDDPHNCKAIYNCFMAGLRAYGDDYDFEVERKYLNKFCGHKL